MRVERWCVRAGAKPSSDPADSLRPRSALVVRCQSIGCRCDGNGGDSARDKRRERLRASDGDTARYCVSEHTHQMDRQLGSPRGH